MIFHSEHTVESLNHYIIVGDLYLNDCPAQRWIPIYLIVAGSVTLLKFVLDTIWNRVQYKRKLKEEKGMKFIMMF